MGHRQSDPAVIGVLGHWASGARVAQACANEETVRWVSCSSGDQVRRARGVTRRRRVIDVAGEASILMNIQEMSTAVQHRLPVKIFILNNQYMGMVRQWQQLLHGNRLSHSYTEAMPDFVKLAEAYGGVGIRCEKPGELDDAIRRMIDTPAPVIFDCRVANLANCFPMIPSGKAHYEMILGDEAGKPGEQKVSEEGMVLV